MKKLLSFGLALAMTAAMAVTAFAADVAISFDMKDEAGNDISASNLEPNQEYRFPVLIKKDDAEPADFSEADMKDHKFTISITKGGAAIETPKIEETNGKYELVVKTKANFTSKTTEAGFKVRYLVKSSSKEVAATQVDLKIGFSKMPEGTIDGIGQGEDVPVSNATPIITAKQFEKLAKLNDYKAVTLAGQGWTYTVNLTQQKDQNLYSHNGVIKEISQKFENQEFRYLTFSGNPDFGVKGTLSVDVTDAQDDFGGKFYLYRYLGGKLYSLTNTYSEDEGSLSFRPSQLGSYVITNKEISSKDLVVNPNADSGSGGSSSGGGSNGSEPNPETGANDVVGLAAALAVMALAAGALALKRR